MNEPGFDFKDPKYGPVYIRRMQRLLWIRENPENLALMWAFYRDNLDCWISDWCSTIDPRNVERGLPASVPFLLFPKQREWVKWIVARWKAGEPGITEKTRDVGMSWLSVAVACGLCTFHQGMSIGFGSRKEEYVDKLGHPKSLFYKARALMNGLPDEFKLGWDDRKHAPHMRIEFPGTGSVITGEAGDGIGRGDRQGIYLVDEAAFLERPMLVEASLSATTNCRQDISTPNGPGNPFAQKRHGGKVPVFTFHWRDDPRKDDAWYAKMCELLDPVTVAQEIDINYNASIENQLIPSEWVQAAVGAHLKLGIEISGERIAGMDIADQGADKNAVAQRHSILLESCQDWSGKGSDIMASVSYAFLLCDMSRTKRLRYDADGMGAGVRGDARTLNEKREELGVWSIDAIPHWGSGAVVNPDAPIPTARVDVDDPLERTNGDFFRNYKAQAWWALRLRFQRTFRAVNGLDPDYDPDALISLAPEMAGLTTLTAELAQVTYRPTENGKIVIDKAPEGTKSPNKADAVVIAYAPTEEVVTGFGVLL